MKRLLYSLVLLFTLSCQNTDSNEKSEAGEENAPEETVEVNPETKALRELSLPVFKTDSVKVSAEEFEVREIANLDKMAGTPIDEKKLAPFRHLLIYNADSTLAADLFSYNYIEVEKGGKPAFTAGEPDTEIALIDLKARTRKRLFFTGPSFIAADAKWTENGKLIIIGGEQIEKEIRPVAWKIDVRTSEMQFMDYPDTLALDLASYVEQKLNSGSAKNSRPH